MITGYDRGSWVEVVTRGNHLSQKRRRREEKKVVTKKRQIRGYSKCLGKPLAADMEMSSRLDS